MKKILIIISILMLLMATGCSSNNELELTLENNSDEIGRIKDENSNREKLSTDKEADQRPDKEAGQRPDEETEEPVDEETEEPVDEETEQMVVEETEETVVEETEAEDTTEVRPERPDKSKDGESRRGNRPSDDD